MINHRLDIVEVFVKSTVQRNQLIDGPLKSVPDLDLLMSRMQKKNAGLEEVFRLYVFTRSLPTVVGVLADMVDTFDVSVDESDRTKSESIRCRYITPISVLIDKFLMYQQLVEHVIDMEQLPSFEINPQHDPELLELRQERDDLEARADKLLAQARSGWAACADVRLEHSTQHGLIFRSTKGDDERQLRASNSSVRILSLLKVRRFLSQNIDRLTFINIFRDLCFSPSF